MLSVTRALLDRNRVDVGIVTSWKHEDLPADIRNRLSSYTHQALKKPRVLDVIRQGFLMPSIARRLGADLILNVDPIGTPRGGAYRFTVVHDVYQKILSKNFKLRERIFNDIIMRLMIRNSHAIICVSDCTKNDLDRFYPSASKKSKRIYGDAGLGHNLAEAMLDNKTTERHLLWVGKITSNKNVDVLYKALRVLADRGQHVSAVIVGDDVFGHAEKAEREFGAGLHVKRMGRISDAELVNLYAKSFCFLNTSSYEGFGMPIIEAQRMGLPVICSAGGAVAEIAGMGALIFDHSDPGSLADCIEKLSSNENLREELVIRGFENASRFSWEETARSIEELATQISS